MGGPQLIPPSSDAVVVVRCATTGPDAVVVRLIEGIARGDSAALTVFYDQWFDRAYDMARGLTRRDEAFCLDVVQDAMLKVIRKLRPALGITTRGGLDAWFTRVVHTTAIDQLRREARRHGREAGPRKNAQEQPSASDLAQLDERLRWLTAELSRLEGEEAALVDGRFRGERSLEVVGAAHGLSGGAVHGRVRRVLERLRRAGKERFHE